MRTPRTALMVAFCSAALTWPLNASLIHRYSFSEAPGTTTVKDSVGTADGTIKGNGADFTGAGTLYLNGGTGSDAAADAISGYVDLPNHIVNTLTDISVEAWVTWEGSSIWQRVFDFGTSAGGEDIVNGNGNYLFLTPAGPSYLRFAVRDPVTGAEPTQLTAGAALENSTEVCLTVTYDTKANLARLYKNAVLVAFGPTAVPLNTINDVNNWLGRSQWADPMFQGSFNEFRIYDNALNPVEVAASYLAGTETPSTDPGSLGAVQAIHLSVPQTTMKEQDTQTASATADFANIAGVSLLGVTGASYESDTPAVLTVDVQGGIKAVSFGTAKVTVSYLGKSDSVTITVNRRATGVAVAGQLWVDLRAVDAKNDTSVWPNRAGTGAADDFYATGAPVYEANVAGTGLAGVKFGGQDAYAGPNTTADLDGGSDRSIEVWAYNPSLADEETLVAWGRRGGPDRSNMSFNYGANATWGAVGHWGDDMGWGANPAPGEWHYLVYTYDGDRTARVYADGVLKTTRILGGQSVTYADMPIRIGAQFNDTGTDFDFGQALSGDIALVRVHGGMLSGPDVANNFLYGVELTDPGDLLGVALAVNPASLVGARTTGQAIVRADYANRKYLDVLGSSTLESSDPAVLTIDAAGVYTAVKPGTVTLKATYKGFQASQVVTVLAPPATELKHRYSFNEAVGSTTVADSVGGANGEVKGNGAAFDGAGQLSLPGGTGSAAGPDTVAGYVDLPNHIIKPLTSVSFEAWITWNGSGVWERIFDFGTSAGGEDVVNGNGNYFFLSPAGAANLRFAVRDPRTGGEPTQLTSRAPLAKGEEIYVAAVYDYPGNWAGVYSNGVLVVSGVAAVPVNLINDVNNWLGRSQWNDAMFQGSYNEFRIWEGALTADQVAADYAAGPNTVPSTAPPPTLSLGWVGTDLVLSWPATATGFTLQWTAALGPAANWVAIDTSGAVVENGQKKLKLSTQNSAAFYRMKK